jgi:AhpC/TSA family
MPHLSDLWSEVSSQRQDVEFLAVDLNDSTKVISTWWRDSGFKLRAVQQHEGDVSAAFGVQAYPTNYVIGPDGKVIWCGVGYDPAMIRGVLATTLKPAGG